MSLPARTTLSALLALTLCACSGDDEKSTPGGFTQVEIDHQARLAEVLCHEWFACPDWIPREYASEAACVTHLRSLGVVDGEEHFRVTHTGGTYDPAAFERCMQRRLAHGCLEPRAWDADCDLYLQGNRALGQTCFFSSECANGWCDPGTCEGWFCVARRPEGSTCGLDEQCEPGLVCSRATGRCAAEERFPGPDEACGPALACGPGHHCTSLEAPGTCVPLPREGEPCGNLLTCGGGFGGSEGCRGIMACAPGFTCTIMEVEGMVDLFCTAMHFGAEGDACRDDGELCDGAQLLHCFTAMMSQYSDTCVAVAPAGTAAPLWQGACEPNNADHTCCWDDAYWKDDFCHPRKRLGERCDNYKECFSRNCEIEPGGSASVCTLFYYCMVNNINDVNHEE